MPTDAGHESPEGASTGASSSVTTSAELGPFVTCVTRLRADGARSAHTSRRHRKGLGPLAIASPDVDPMAAAAAVGHEWHRFWAPRRIGWWIAVLFMIGSALFALGGALATWPDAPGLQWIDQGLIGWIFFIGALFFTGAAYLQWLEALNNDVTNLARPNGSGPRRWRFLGWCPHNLGYLAASVQLVGTVLFNFNTADALIAGLGWEGQDLLVWTPDIAGSICFLVASQLAVMEVSHHFWSFQPRNLSWWIAAINLLGSVLFMVSAVASFVEPGAVMASPWLANFGTFAGAVCFFIGAYLLIPELFEEAIKTGLAMVIAYGIALRMGWDNPFWPALTVLTLNMMTIGQSLPRAIMRTSGTLVGCVAALAILGVFPQERWWFMVGLSLYVGFCTYMMKGKSVQYFWFLAALTCLIIPFKSMPLEAATAFEEAWLRTVETATGALVWMLVAAFLWPRSSLGAFNEASRKLWATQAQLYRAYRGLMSGSGTAEDSRPLRPQEIQLVAQVGRLLDAAEADSYQVWELRHQWRRFHHQSTALMEALERWRQGFAEIQPLNLTGLLPNLEAVCSELDQRFEQIERMLADEAPSRTAQPIDLAVDKAEMRALTRFEEAAVVVTQTQLEILERLSRSLFDCVADIRGYTRRAAKPLPDATVRRGLAIDPDRFAAAMTVTMTQWIAFLLWVYINPPEGAGFAMMAVIFALIMQMAPAAKLSLQYLSWGAGAAFAGVLYVFVMPHLSGFVELAVLIFAANFAMYYVLGAPRQTLVRILCMVSFCILLTVDNQQSYSFSHYANLVTGLIMLPLTVAAAARYITASPRPEKVFMRLLRRFFRHAEFVISGLALDGEQKKGIAGRWKAALYRNDLLELPAKLAACGQQIDTRTFPANTPEQVQALVASVYGLANRIKDLVEARGASQAEQVKTQLLEDLRDWRRVIEGRIQLRAEQTRVGIESGADVRDRLAARLAGLEASIGETLAQAGEGELSSEDLKSFYRLLGSYRGLSEAAIGYAQLADSISWAQWREARF